MTTLQEWIKRTPVIKRWTLWVTRMISPMGAVHPSVIASYARFVSDWQLFRASGGVAHIGDFWPCLHDRLLRSKIDAQYFYQAVWSFRKILASRVTEHVDVGSEVSFVGLLTTVTRVIFVDIRPLELSIPNYRGTMGSILELPFEAGSIESFSSLHVIEHIGLGRYGDLIDPNGSNKAAREIVRVLAPGGYAYISVPIGRSRVQFNGQRVFAVTDVLRLFDELDLVEMAMVDASGKFHDDVKPESVDISEVGQGSDFGLGLFCFQKRA